MLDQGEAVLSWLMAPGVGEELPSLEEIAHRPAWMERAQAFERRRADLGGARVLSYERYLRDRPEGLADVVQIDSGATGA